MKIPSLIIAFLAMSAVYAGDFMTDGWTPDYCNRVGVAVAPDAVPSGVIAAMHRGDYRAVNMACGTDTRKAGGWVNGCAKNIHDNYWAIWYTNDCVKQHEQCHAMYQTQEHSKYRSVPRERWLTACGRASAFELGGVTQSTD